MIHAISFVGALFMTEGKRVRGKILFVCVHNGARSQILERWLKRLAGDRCKAFGAGMDPCELNSIMVTAMCVYRNACGI
jgi:protein-tyrosine-phosphatase